MNNLNKQSHVKFDCVYHVVIVPKYRKKILFGTIRQRAGEIIRILCKQKGVEVFEGSACPDHIHMVLSIPPKYSVSNVLGFLKGKSAIRLHQEFSRGKSHLTQKSFWSRGYFVRTVGIDKSVVKNYVKNQWKRDKYFDGEQLDLKWN